MKNKIALLSLATALCFSAHVESAQFRYLLPVLGRLAQSTRIAFTQQSAVKVPVRQFHATLMTLTPTNLPEIEKHTIHAQITKLLSDLEEMHEDMEKVKKILNMLETHPKIAPLLTSDRKRSLFQHQKALILFAIERNQRELTLLEKKARKSLTTFDITAVLAHLEVVLEQSQKAMSLTEKLQTLVTTLENA